MLLPTLCAGRGREMRGSQNLARPEEVERLKVVRDVTGRADTRRPSDDNKRRLIPNKKGDRGKVVEERRVVGRVRKDNTSLGVKESEGTVNSSRHIRNPPHTPPSRPRERRRSDRTSNLVRNNTGPRTSWRVHLGETGRRGRGVRL